MHKVGDRVVAQNRITETSQGRTRVHAEPGDVGTVLHVEPPLITVAWARSTSSCVTDELGPSAPIVPAAETVQRLS